MDNTKNVLGCDLKEFCIHKEACNFNKGEYCDGEFRCKCFQNTEMFLNDLVEMCNIDKQ